MLKFAMVAKWSGSEKSDIPLVLLPFKECIFLHIIACMQWQFMDTILISNLILCLRLHYH